MNPVARIVFLSKPRPFKCALFVFLAAWAARRRFDPREVSRLGANIYYGPTETVRVALIHSISKKKGQA
ncbi:MAG TPA: hypothetical protein VLH39_01185 [Magnetospirillaceae bacterium]|nr:hypothetical protein [Magnetospirillaceae bacterium]